MGNTHRAVIETSVPPSLELVGAGPKEFCWEALERWTALHPLQEFQTALVLEVCDD
jgi:hypothetical protein